MQSPVPQSFVQPSSKATYKPKKLRRIFSSLMPIRRQKANLIARRPKTFKGIYFYDDYIDNKVTELKKNLESGCLHRAERTLLKEAIRIAGARASRPWFDKYCSIISKISTYRHEQMKTSFYHFAAIVRAPQFELPYLNHIERLVSSIDSTHSHYGIFLLNRFMLTRKHGLDSQEGARRALPEAGGITSADVDAMCRLINLIASKCNGTSEESIFILAEFFEKESFTLKIIPNLENALSGFEGHQIPPYLEKVNSTFA